MPGIHDPLDHDFDVSATFLAAVQSRLDDLGVVENQQVSGRDHARQVAETKVA